MSRGIVSAPRRPAREAGAPTDAAGGPDAVRIPPPPLPFHTDARRAAGATIATSAIAATAAAATAAAVTAAAATAAAEDAAAPLRVVLVRHSKERTRPTATAPLLQHASLRRHVAFEVCEWGGRADNDAVGARLQALRGDVRL
eukprot:5524976-Prymnesium_polylepis.1